MTCQQHGLGQLLRRGRVVTQLLRSLSTPLIYSLLAEVNFWWILLGDIVCKLDQDRYLSLAELPSHKYVIEIIKGDNISCG